MKYNQVFIILGKFYKEFIYEKNIDLGYLY